LLINWRSTTACWDCDCANSCGGCLSCMQQCVAVGAHNSDAATLLHANFT
jgi:hypothetical protein